MTGHFTIFSLVCSIIVCFLHCSLVCALLCLSRFRDALFIIPSTQCFDLSQRRQWYFDINTAVFSWLFIMSLNCMSTISSSSRIIQFRKFAYMFFISSRKWFSISRNLFEHPIDELTFENQYNHVLLFASGLLKETTGFGVSC